MKRSNHVVRLVEAGLSSCFQMIFNQKPRPIPISFAPSKILFVKSCCLGDAIISLYAIRAFKEKNPAIQIEALVSSRIAEVYQHAPWVDQVHILPVTGYRLAHELIKPGLWVALLLRLWLLRKKRFDLLIDLEVYRKYASLLPRILGIPYSRGFSLPEVSDKFHSENVNRGKEEPEWQCFYKVFGISIPESKPAPLFLKKDVKPLSKNDLTIGIVFGASANWPEKKWPLPYYATVIKELIQKGMKVRLYGLNYEQAEAEELCGQNPELENTVGNLNYPSLLESLSTCDLVIGNDTGTLHASAAVGTACITLFGPTTHLKWNALTSKPLFISGLPCRPCYYLGTMPECDHRSCLVQLKPEKLLYEIFVELERLAAFHPASLS